jgi:hypothetical protein
VFDSLERKGLSEQIDAVIIEWHHVSPRRTQAELLQLLLGRKFFIVDLTSLKRNGFFYASRIGYGETRAS